MRYSHQREIIKEVVYSTNSHPNVEWIYQETRKVIPKISLGTVYRNLKVLERAGQINVFFDGPIARYDWNLNNHHHLKCIKCAKIVDIDNVNVNFDDFKEKKFDFKISEIDITISGTCNKHRN